MDVLVSASMKNAARCATWCELQNSVNHQLFERNWHRGWFRPVFWAQLVRGKHIYLQCQCPAELAMVRCGLVPFVTASLRLCDGVWASFFSKCRFKDTRKSIRTCIWETTRVKWHNLCRLWTDTFLSRGGGLYDIQVCFFLGSAIAEIGKRQLG